MNTPELYQYMTASPVWRAKEKLFAEAFPETPDRVAYFSAFVNRLLDEYRQGGKSTDDLHDLRVRYLAIEAWFIRIPPSLLQGSGLTASKREG